MTASRRHQGHAVLAGGYVGLRELAVGDVREHGRAVEAHVGRRHRRGVGQQEAGLARPDRGGRGAVGVHHRGTADRRGPVQHHVAAGPGADRHPGHHPADAGAAVEAQLVRPGPQLEGPEDRALVGVLTDGPAVDPHVHACARDGLDDDDPAPAVSRRGVACAGDLPAAVPAAPNVTRTRGGGQDGDRAPWFIETPLCRQGTTRPGHCQSGCWRCPDNAANVPVSARSAGDVGRVGDLHAPGVGAVGEILLGLLAGPCTWQVR